MGPDFDEYTLEQADDATEDVVVLHGTCQKVLGTVGTVFDCHRVIMGHYAEGCNPEEPPAIVDPAESPTPA
jgi:7-keto-8-aminopelargonate synthetase-like enzyme